MPEDRPIPLPEPGTLRAGPSPHPHVGPNLVCVTRIFILAATLLLVSGMVLFGWNVFRVLAICVASAALVDSVARAVTGRDDRHSRGQPLLIGMLTACTLPPTVYWPVPLTAAILAVLYGKVISGGLGGCLWHPVVIGRIAVQVLFPEQLDPARWPVLAPEHLVWGHLAAARPLPPSAAWDSQPLAYGVQAWQVLRPADVLASPLSAPADASGPEALAGLVRDTLPPWSHTLTGVAGGAIGEACGLVIIFTGLVLLCQGLARRPLPFLGVLAAAVFAAVLPVTLQPDGGHAVWYWLPGAAVHDGLPVGLVYVLYHLTAGEFLLVVMVLAADPSSSPLTPRGHALFGAIIGGLTVALRVLTGVPAPGYWALLAANALVPLLDRATGRRGFGT